MPFPIKSWVLGLNVQILKEVITYCPPTTPGFLSLCPGSISSTSQSAQILPIHQCQFAQAAVIKYNGPSSSNIIQFVHTVLEARETKIKGTTHLVASEGSNPGQDVFVFSLYSHMECKREGRRAAGKNGWRERRNEKDWRDR